MILTKWRNDDLGVTFRKLTQQAGRRFAQQTVAISDELPRDMQATFLARARKELREFIRREQPAS